MSAPASLRYWRIALLVVFLLVPIANYLPIVLDISQDRFTNGTETRIDAAGYAFSIWGVIFLGMILFAAFQFRTPRHTVHLVRAIRFLVVAGLASIAFVPISFGANYLWGAVDLLWHLVALLGAYVALRAHVREVGPPAYGWTWFAPSMYLGWISAATVISTALALQQVGVTFAPPTEVAVATGLVVVLTLLGIYLGLRRDGIYAFTVAWALVGVAVEQQDAALISWAASAGAMCLVILGGAGLLSRRDFFYAT
ncbi:hypothetical protein [Lewinella sp. IMCC34183]|uniref:hypothetical protein n=1 Tax=Lewinella sp. IMCC34183 TaxID=2248762 RepID=UPI000E267B8D|nr:hypothetical protein [Lewinella sp. IMCC34183]